MSRKNSKPVAAKPATPVAARPVVNVVGLTSFTGPVVAAAVATGGKVATPKIAAVTLASFTGPVTAVVANTGNAMVAASVVDVPVAAPLAVESVVVDGFVGPLLPRIAAKHVAKGINFARAAVDTNAGVAAALVVKTAAGTNASKAKVYGYDNGAAGGGVPKGAIIALVPAAKSPAGVTPGQWALLQTFAGKTVATAYDNGVASRSVRRAYRAGAIRFVAA